MEDVADEDLGNDRLILCSCRSFKARAHKLSDVCTHGEFTIKIHAEIGHFSDGW